MELNEAIIRGKKEMEEKFRKARTRALEKKLIIIAIAVIVFLVSFFSLFKHREVEMSFKQFKILEMLLPLGYTARYETGIAIIENFVDALVLSILLSLESGALTGLIAVLYDFKN